MVTPHCRVAIQWANNGRAELPLGRGGAAAPSHLGGTVEPRPPAKTPHFSTFKEVLGLVA